MKYTAMLILLLVGGLSSKSVWAVDKVGDESGTKAADADCSRQDVDTADEMNFAEAIVECDQGATVLYDAESRRSFLKRRNLPEKVYEKRAASLDESMITGRKINGDNAGEGEAVHVPGAAFIIRESYSISAPDRALAALHRQMATYCPRGWEKDREWSSPAGNQYFLHFEFTCSAEE